MCWTGQRTGSFTQSLSAADLGLFYLSIFFVFPFPVYQLWNPSHYACILQQTSPQKQPYILIGRRAKILQLVFMVHLLPIEEIFIFFKDLPRRGYNFLWWDLFQTVQTGNNFTLSTRNHEGNETFSLFKTVFTAYYAFLRWETCSVFVSLQSFSSPCILCHHVFLCIWICVSNSATLYSLFLCLPWSPLFFLLRQLCPYVQCTYIPVSPCVSAWPSLGLPYFPLCIKLCLPVSPLSLSLCVFLNLRCVSLDHLVSPCAFLCLSYVSLDHLVFPCAFLCLSYVSLDHLVYPCAFLCLSCISLDHPVSPCAFLRLPLSPFISLCLYVSLCVSLASPCTSLRLSVSLYVFLRLPVYPCVSLRLPVSPMFSLWLKLQFP